MARNWTGGPRYHRRPHASSTTPPSAPTPRSCAARPTAGRQAGHHPADASRPAHRATQGAPLSAQSGAYHDRRPASPTGQEQPVRDGRYRRARPTAAYGRRARSAWSAAWSAVPGRPPGSFGAGMARASSRGDRRRGHGSSEANVPQIPVGIDGETMLHFGPVRCAIRPRALRVIVPRERPGVPAAEPALEWPRLRQLAGFHARCSLMELTLLTVPGCPNAAYSRSGSQLRWPAPDVVARRHEGRRWSSASGGGGDAGSPAGTGSDADTAHHPSPCRATQVATSWFGRPDRWTATARRQ